MTQTDGRTALLDILEDEGVTHIFGNPGTTELPLMDVLAGRPGITYVLGLQEIVALGMAEGYSRASGKLSMVNVHVAPGLGNAMGALYTAKISGAPILVTAGQHEAGLALTEPLLFDSMVPMAEPMVKWATVVSRVEDLPRILRRAAKVALTPPTGPVFLALPTDVLMNVADLELGRSTRVDATTVPTPEALRGAAARLLQAEAPLILTGHEISSEDAFAELARVAELLGAPVHAQTVPHSAQFASEHPLFVGVVPRNQERVRALLGEVDLLFAAGADVFTMSLPGPVEPVPPALAVVQMGQRDWELGKNFPAEIALRCALKPTLKLLAEQIETFRTPEQAAAAARRAKAVEGNNWRVRREKLKSSTLSDAGSDPIKADFLMLKIAEEIPEDGVIVDEAVTSSSNLLKFLSLRDSHSFYGLPSGGLGWGIPGSIGVQLALPERPLLAVIGDGSANYSIQGLYTAALNKLPITYVICNNRSYRILKQRLYLYDGPAAEKERFIGMDFQNPQMDWVKLAEGYGLRARRVTKAEEVVPALREGLQGGVPNLIDVHLDDVFKP